jgi:hypothetical protein
VIQPKLDLVFVLDAGNAPATGFRALIRIAKTYSPSSGNM